MSAYLPDHFSENIFHFMSLGSGILVLIAIWCLIHLLHYFTSHKPSSIFPTNSQLRRSSRHARVSLHFLHLKITTTSWNTYHDKLSTFLARKEKYRINALFKLTYDIGTIFCSVGIVIAVAALLWICTSSVWMLFQKMSLSRRSTGTSDIMKRAISDLETSKTLQVSSPYLEITPIVSMASSGPFHHFINPIIHRYLE